MLWRLHSCVTIAALTACPVFPPPAGEYTVGGADKSTRVSVLRCEPGHFCADGVMAPCPPGRFACASSVSDPQCSGPCDAGYYCPLASALSKAVACGGPWVYCPTGAAVPVPVDVGYVSVGGLSDSTRVAQALCPSGSYCVNGTQVCACVRV